jgi:hypothetical protein
VHERTSEGRSHDEDGSPVAYPAPSPPLLLILSSILGATQLLLHRSRQKDWWVPVSLEARQRLARPGTEKLLRHLFGRTLTSALRPKAMR